MLDKTSKSGCRADEARLRTAERLVKLISVFSTLSWRVTVINRSVPDAEPGLALTIVEIQLLDQLELTARFEGARGVTISALGDRM